jgi:hypothetical protein
MEKSRIRARVEEGLPLDDVLVIDAHCHVGGPGWGYPPFETIIAS